MTTRRKQPDRERDVAAWRALLLAHNRAVRAIEADLDATEAVPLGWYDVLLELQAEPDGLRMQDLGERAVLSRTRVSRLVDGVGHADSFRWVNSSACAVFNSR